MKELSIIISKGSNVVVVCLNNKVFLQQHFDNYDSVYIFFYVYFILARFGLVRTNNSIFY
jgi:hypothetical protein